MGKFNKTSKADLPAFERICSCGQHQGIGSWSARDRALAYNWFRQKYQQDYSGEQRRYLESYEAAHGKLRQDEFIFNK